MHELSNLISVRVSTPFRPPDIHERSSKKFNIATGKKAFFVFVSFIVTIKKNLTDMGMGDDSC